MKRYMRCLARLGFSSLIKANAAAERMREAQEQSVILFLRNVLPRIPVRGCPQRRKFYVKTMAELFEHTLKDVYYAENAIVKALPKVSAAVKNSKLKGAVEAHLEETKGQIETLKKVFKTIDVTPEGVKCDAADGLIKEAESLMEEAQGVALDAGLIGACQAVEHYEICRYGSLREWAKVLGNEQAHILLSEILDQEKAANAKLTTLAITTINSK